MGFYDTPDYDYNAEAARQEAQRQAEYQAQRQANDNMNRAMYDNNGNNNGGGDWHVDAICFRIGFSETDANIIKCEYDRVLQRVFGGNPTQNTPKQYQAPRSNVRLGDPDGVIGSTFSVVRSVYFSLENTPVLNSLKLWAFVDSVVLRNNTNPVVQSYLSAVKKGVTTQTAQ